MSLLLRIFSSSLHTNSSVLMAGHSKWANIKHTKALKDGHKAAIFTKLTRQLRLAIQDGGSVNPELNSSLRNVIDIAIRKNMPMSTIQHTIKKFESNKTQLQKYLLEMRAFNKIYMICTLYTDNFAGLKMLIAPIIKKAGGTFISAQHLFDDNGIIEAIICDNLKEKTCDELEELCTEHAIEIGAENVEIIDDKLGIVNFECNPVDLVRISKLLTDKGYFVENAEHIFAPKVYINVSEKDALAYEVFQNKLKAVEGFEEIYDNLEPTSSPSST